jgi:hypothetical protein
MFLILYYIKILFGKPKTKNILQKTTLKARSSHHTLFQIPNIGMSPTSSPAYLENSPHFLKKLFQTPNITTPIL